MKITARAARWTAPVDARSTDGPFQQICAIDATPMLPHTVGKRHYRKNAPAVACAINTLGKPVALCSNCRSLVEVVQWHAKIGSTEDLSEGRLAALSYVWRAELGFTMPIADGFPGGLRTLGAVQHHLARLVSEGLVKKIGTLYLMRDACPSCFRRGGCAAECMLHMGEDFAPRREACLL